MTWAKYIGSPESGHHYWVGEPNNPIICAICKQESVLELENVCSPELDKALTWLGQGLTHCISCKIKILITTYTPEIIELYRKRVIEQIGSENIDLLL